MPADPPAPDEAAPAPALAPDDRAGRSCHLPLLVAGVAAVLLVVGTIGPPLVGRGVFLSSDLIYLAYPWKAERDPATLDVGRSGPVSDTVDAAYPARALFAEDLRDGHFLGWSPWEGGGQPVGATSGSGVLNPLALLPFALVPAWYAPALVKLLVMAMAIGFTHLFCRRLGAGRPAAVLAGMAFAGSGFMVMWTNWPQVEVAAWIPVLFWGTERFLQERNLSSIVAIAVATAGMLLGAFPAVAGYALYVLVPYVAVRLLAGGGRSGEPVRDPDASLELAEKGQGDGPAGDLAEQAGQRGADPDPARGPTSDPTPVRRGRDVVVGAAGVGAGLVVGALLVAAVLLPFAARLGDNDLDYRAQGPDDNLGIPTLLTSVAPTAFGLSSQGRPYRGPVNPVEAIAFVGVTTAVLALLAVALPRSRRTPAGVVPVLTGATLVIGVATFAGGPPLSLLQNLPVFTNSFVGRTRSVLGFTVAVLAALGLEAVLAQRSRPGVDRRRLLLTVTVAGLAAGFVALRSAQWARRVSGGAVLRDGLVLPVVVAVLVAVALVVLVRRATPGWARRAALAALPALFAVEALALAGPLLPDEDRSTLYPETPATEFLRAHAGHDRVAVEGETYYGNTGGFYGLRMVAGHLFYAPTWQEMLSIADPRAFELSPTNPRLHAEPEVVTAAVLDRLGARWFATTPETVPLGRPDEPAAEASCPTSSPATGERAEGTDPAGGTERAEDNDPAGGAERAGGTDRTDRAGGADAAPRAAGSAGEAALVGEATVAGGDGLRGIEVQVCDDVAVPPDAALVVRAEGGGRTASGRLALPSRLPARELVLAVPAEGLAGVDEVTVTLEVTGAPGDDVTLATTADGRLAVTPIRPADDGLRLRYADDLRIYERTTALPRIRWAGRAEVIRRREDRLGRVASPDLPDDTVVLSQGEPRRGRGSTAEIEVVDDRPDRIRLRVDAGGEGYVVVADALQEDWSATLDGEPVDLVDADHAGVAVRAPAGRHEVVLRLAPRGQRTGLVLSTVAALAVLAAVTVTAVRRRRRSG